MTIDDLLDRRELRKRLKRAKDRRVVCEREHRAVAAVLDDVLILSGRLWGHEMNTRSWMGKA